MKPMFKKTMVAVLCCLLVMAPTNRGISNPDIITNGATIIGAAAALSAVLKSAINEAAEEVRRILQEALTGAQNLEAATADDLRDLEKMTRDDLDRLTANRMSDLDNLLQGTLAQLIQAGNQIDAALANQIKDAIGKSLLLWDTISKDLDNKIIKIERGIAKILDASLIQIIRIALIIASVAMVIVGLILMKKIKKPALITMIAGAVLLVFSLTPLFPLALSNFRSIEKEIPLNTPLPPPSIFAVYPSPPLKWQQTGNIELIGLNFISHGGISSFLRGDKADALVADETASFEPSKVSVSMKPVTQKSGTYYLKIIRNDADGKTVESQLITIYVQKPEEIPVSITYKIWQAGQWNSYSNTSWQIRVTQSDHSWGKTRKCYTRERYVEGWHMKSFTKKEHSANKVDDLNERIENDYFKVDFCLTSGPKWDTYRGWYEADYILNLYRSRPGNTEEMASRGELILYLDEETGQVKVATNTIFKEEFGIAAYEASLGGRISASQIPAEQLKKSEIFDTIQEYTIEPKLYFKPKEWVKFKENPKKPIIEPGRIIDPSILERFLKNSKSVEREILVGKAPTVPGFAGEKAYYDVMVVFPTFRHAELNKEGTTPVYDDNGILVMSFDTDKHGQLWARWLYSPK